MDPERWEKAREVFQAALELDPGEWKALLDRLCGGDPALRAEALALLEAHQAAGIFLEEPIVGREEGEPEEAPKDPFVGRKIGSYQVVRLLGRGGMGSVYLALRADDEFQKRVALKVLSPGMQSGEIVRRFRTERQILAALDHPNVARLLDGGSTEEGLPYLVMDYVEGKAIDDYCDSHRLSTRARLEMFCAVCSAVQYAHRNLVVHRDLKSSNILVTAEGTPKLLDFGIAKLLNPELAAPELAPTAPVMRLMTPDYASPEQVQGQPITTAADIYSLGVLLYYLLTGHRPYHVESRSPVEILRVICEQEPESPSTIILREEEIPGPQGNLTTVTPESVSRTRDGNPARLRRRLVGDLDNIVLKAMRKEPERRYTSVEQLAEDVRRHLEGRPVLARKATFIYRCGKFLRRHRIAASAATALVLASLTFGLVMGIQRQQIGEERDRAERIKTFLVELLEATDPVHAKGQSVTLQELLDSATLRLATELAELPETQADLLETLGVIYTRLGSFDQAAELLGQALDTRRELFGHEHLKVAESLNSLADLWITAGDSVSAETLLREAMAIRLKLRGGEHAEVAETLNDLGKALHRQGRLNTAEDCYRDALKMRRRVLGPQHVEVAETLNNLAVLLWQRGDYATAQPLHRQALAMREALLGRDHIEVSESLNNLAALLRDQGDLEEAQAKYERALALRRQYLGEEHPRVATALNNLAGVLQDKGDFEAAEQLYHSALVIYRKKHGERHHHVAGSLRNLATLRQQQGNFDEAEDFFRQAETILRETVGHRHPMLAWNSALLAGLLEARGSFREAEALATEALAILGSTRPRDHWQVAAAEGTLAASFVGQGRFEEAEPILIRSYHTLKSAPSKRAALALHFVQQHLVELYEAVDKSLPGDNDHVILTHPSTPPGI